MKSVYRFQLRRKSRAAITAAAIVASLTSQIQADESGAISEVERLTTEEDGVIFQMNASAVDDRICYIKADGGERGLKLWVSDEDGSNGYRLSEAIGDPLFPKWSPTGEYIGYRTFSHGGNHLWCIPAEGGEPVQVSGGWTAEAYDWAPDGEHFVWTSHNGGGLNLFVSHRDGTAVRQVTFSKLDCRNPQWSPNGDWIAFRSNRSSNMGLSLVRPDGTEERTLTDGSRFYQFPYWSPDGRYIVSQVRNGRIGDWSLWLVDLAGNEEKLPLGDGNHFAPRWSSNGESIYYWSNSGKGTNLWEFQLESGETRQLSEDGRGGGGVVLGSAGGLIFNRWAGSGADKILNLDTGEAVSVGLKPNAKISPNGKWMAYTDYTEGKASLAIVPFEDQDAEPIAFEDLEGMSGDYQWSDASDSVAFVQTAASRDVWIANLDGDMYSVSTDVRDDEHPRWSPDGTKLAYLSRKGPANMNVWVYNVPTGKSEPLTKGLNVYDLSWNPEGTKVYYSAFSPNGGNPALSVVDLGTGDSQSLTAGHYDYDSSLSSDGKVLVFRRMEVDTNLFAIDLESGKTRRLSDVAGHDAKPIWSNDGSFLVFEAGGKIHRWERKTNELKVLSESDEFDQSPVWLSEDGTRLLVHEGKGGSSLYRVSTGENPVGRLSSVGQSGKEEFN